MLKINRERMDEERQWYLTYLEMDRQSRKRKREQLKADFWALFPLVCLIVCTIANLVTLYLNWPALSRFF